MRLLLALSAVLPLLVPIFASPLPLEVNANTSSSALVARQTAARTCGTTPYSIGAQDNAFHFASTLDTIGETVTGLNDSPYPHVFNNIENIDFPDCPGVPGPFREFPILSTGTLFTSANQPRPDRIVYKVTGTAPVNDLPDQFAYCGVITHTGQTGNTFVLCS